MDLQFKKEGTVWVAEFEATSDFNLHLERVENGSVSVAQSGIQGGEYDVAFRKNMYEVKNFDYDFGALVYPKYIKVTSGSEVIKGVVNFNVGGGSGSESGGSEASTVEYLDVRNFGLSDSFSMFVISAKCIIDSDYVIAPIIMLAQQDDPILYCALDFNQKIKFPGGTLMSVKDFLITRGFTQEQLDAIPRITKEEFYNISE